MKKGGCPAPGLGAGGALSLRRPGSDPAGAAASEERRAALPPLPGRSRSLCPAGGRGPGREEGVRPDSAPALGRRLRAVSAWSQRAVGSARGGWGPTGAPFARRGPRADPKFEAAYPHGLSGLMEKKTPGNSQGAGDGGAVWGESPPAPGLRETRASCAPPGCARGRGILGPRMSVGALGVIRGRGTHWVSLPVLPGSMWGCGGHMGGPRRPVLLASVCGGTGASPAGPGGRGGASQPGQACACGWGRRAAPGPLPRPGRPLLSLPGAGARRPARFRRCRRRRLGAGDGRWGCQLRALHTNLAA